MTRKNKTKKGGCCSSIIAVIIILIAVVVIMPSDKNKENTNGTRQVTTETATNSPTPHPASTEKALPTKIPTLTPTDTPTPRPTATPTPEPASASVSQAGTGGGEPLFESTPVNAEPETTYILNTSSHKYHRINGPDTGTIAEHNRAETTMSREELDANGYTACGRCFG